MKICLNLYFYTLYFDLYILYIIYNPEALHLAHLGCLYWYLQYKNIQRNKILKNTFDLL